MDGGCVDQDDGLSGPGLHVGWKQLGLLYAGNPTAVSSPAKRSDSDLDKSSSGNSN